MIRYQMTLFHRPGIIVAGCGYDSYKQLAHPLTRTVPGVTIGAIALIFT